MTRFVDVAARDALEAEMDYSLRDLPRTVFQALSRTRDVHPDRKAISFQLFSAPDAPARSLNWTELHERVTETTNLFRSLGIGERDVVAYMLPNCLETPVVLLAGATAGIVNPINPLLEPEQIAGILRETGAKVLVTLKSFPKSDIAQKAALAVAMAPGVETVLDAVPLRSCTIGQPRAWSIAAVSVAARIRL